MGIYRSEISDLRRNIGENIGQKVIIKESPGKRSKPLEKMAIIENTYKDYFRIKYEGTNRFNNINYVDLLSLSGNTTLKIDNGNGFEPIIEPQIEIKRR